jgi:hypothetical protein
VPAARASTRDLMPGGTCGYSATAHAQRSLARRNPAAAPPPPATGGRHTWRPAARSLPGCRRPGRRRRPAGACCAPAGPARAQRQRSPGACTPAWGQERGGGGCPAREAIGARLAEGRRRRSGAPQFRRRRAAEAGSPLLPGRSTRAAPQVPAPQVPAPAPSTAPGAAPAPAAAVHAGGRT